MKWEPKEGETYCIILIMPTFKIEALIWENEDIDKYLYKSGNCFRTKKEAEAKLKAIKKILKA